MVSVLLIAAIIPVGAVPTYQAVPTGTTWDFVEVYDTAAGVEFGKARINYANWQSGEYWYYAYQIINNDYFNTPSNPNDDYHFGWLNMTGITPNPSVYETIHSFSLNLDPNGTGFGPSDTVILDTLGGSSAGSGAWGSTFDPGKAGIDWAVALGSGTPLGIAPARGQWVEQGSGKNKVTVWSPAYAGDASRSDSNGQYFMIASKWAPSLRKAAITSGVSHEAWAYIEAPGVAPVIPEPASVVTLLGGAVTSLALIRRKRFLG
jgi:hypothetical protein